MKYFIYGAGGHAKVVWDAMKKSNLFCEGFLDDCREGQWIDLPIFKSSFLNEINDIELHIAIGNCKVREEIAKKFKNFKFFSIYHPDAVISSRAKIEVGTFLAAGSIISPDANVGKHVIVNHHAVIDHDSSVGDFCHIAPHASLGGGVKVGQSVLIGAGAIVLPGITIADCVTVGAGSIVTNDIASGVTVVGNPARAI
ncbi:acetyltransferase [Candidatus Methylopumilus rimovensis]|uniref:Acetyltransferase n=1 Tax=Candidatus Methylopumilus rimovensis TaxID=2588535 RepID=A0AAE6FST8_9PROT|nr:acetyltransferase [Candidatus Methylopumilus rimovensis]QDD13386.1 acetyltransferase [Candidatus Methylopumilus rimovensis]